MDDDHSVEEGGEKLKLFNQRIFQSPKPAPARALLARLEALLAPPAPQA